MIMCASTQTIVLSGLLLSSIVIAAPGGGLIADQTAGTRITAQNQTYAITGGVLQGGNLLHSFREFNLESGEVADFQALPQTQQIISRVTGSNNSWLNGTVRVSGGSQADLYLLNPNGVLFGQDASLDVPGGLYASTADYVLLADGQRLYADPEQGLNLTVAAPEAFGFLDDRVGEIRVEGSRLSVTEGETISLVGGGIQLTGSNTNSALLQVLAGQINLTAVASAGEAARDGAVITNPVQADINMQHGWLNTDNQTESTTTGYIRLRGNQITIGASELWASNFSAYNPEPGDSVILEADQQVILDQSRIDLDAYRAGNGGTLAIRAPEIKLSRKSGILSDTHGSGQGGVVILVADQQVVLEQQSGISLATKSQALDAGNSGILHISASEIQLTQGSTIDSGVYGVGQGGKVWLQAGQRVLLDGRSGISSATLSTGGANQGQGGDLIITAPIIELTNTGVIYAQTFGTGPGGLVSLNATEDIRLSGQGTIISSAAHGSGHASGIQVQARNLQLTDGASIQSTGGFVFNPPSWVDTEGLPVGVPRTGAAGRIWLDLTGVLHLSGRSEINTSAAGSGSAGDILIGTRQRPTKIRLLDASRIISKSESQSEAAGKAGQLNILAQDTIALHGGSSFSTASQNAGGDGRGGDIHVDPVFILLENSRIQANAHGGPGGNITLVAEHLLLSGPSVIEASSAQSVPGEVDVQAHVVDGGSLQIVTGLELLDTAQWLPVPCHEQQNRIGHLIMAGYDAHPTAVSDLLSAVSVRAMTSVADRKNRTKKGLQ